MKPEEINVAKDDGGTAFPFQPFGQDRGAMAEAESGMSLRDYFAAKAMEADIVNVGLEGSDVLFRSQMSYEQADAMLKARKWVETKGEGE